MSNIRFSWLRPGGWTRLGVAGAVGILFGTPMLWALGSFGNDAEAINRALIFMFAGLWFFIGTGYALGWSIRGFIVRLKEDEGEEGGGGHRPPPMAHPPGAGAGAGAPHRPPGR